MSNDGNERIVFCGNLHESVTEEILFELFLQAGPLENVKIATEKSGQKKSFAFITFKHADSVPYTIKLMDGIRLFGKPVRLQLRTGSTHLADNRQHSPDTQRDFHRSVSAPDFHQSPRLDVQDRGRGLQPMTGGLITSPEALHPMMATDRMNPALARLNPQGLPPFFNNMQRMPTQYSHNRGRSEQNYYNDQSQHGHSNRRQKRWN